MFVEVRLAVDCEACEAALFNWALLWKEMGEHGSLWSHLYNGGDRSEETHTCTYARHYHIITNEAMQSGEFMSYLLNDSVLQQHDDAFALCERDFKQYIIITFTKQSF